MLHWLQTKWLSPHSFYLNSGRVIPVLLVVFLIFISYGTMAGLFIAPADYQQGDGFRIMYVHVPSALTAMAIYFTMACCALCTLVWRIKIAAIAMHASAAIGAWFTFLALVTGSIWGNPCGALFGYGMQG